MKIEAKEYTLKDGSKLIIKSPEPSDALSLVENIMVVSGETENIYVTPERANEFLNDLEGEEKFIINGTSGSNCLVCAYDNGKIVATCDLNVMFGRASHRGVIGITIQHKYINKGLGSILFDIIIDAAKQTKGIEQLELMVAKSNDIAKHLYIKKGFVKYGEEPRAIKKSDGSYVDGETMVLFLK